MAVLQATLIGARVRPWLDGGGSGEVHSIFRRVCNLSWGDWLISLHTAEGGALPCGVMLRGDVDFLSLGLQPGQPVRWRPHEQGLSVGHWIVSLREAGTWVDPAALQWDVGLLGRNAAVLLDLTRRHGRGSVRAQITDSPAPGRDVAVGPASGQDVAGRMVWERGLQLGEVLRKGDAAAVGPAVRRLLGLGEGLTPSGDDLVLGMMAALHYGGGALRPELAGCARMLGESVKALAPAATTRVSDTYLRLAALGAFSERLAEAAAAVLGGASGQALQEPVLRLLEHGHSSGTDTAVGLYLGTQVLMA